MSNFQKPKTEGVVITTESESSPQTGSPVVPQSHGSTPFIHRSLRDTELLRQLKVSLRAWMTISLTREWNEPEGLTDGKLDEEMYMYIVLNDMLDELIVNSFDEQGGEKSKNSIANAFYNMSNDLQQEKNTLRKWFTGECSLNCVSGV